MRKLMILLVLFCTAVFAQQGKFTDARDGKVYKYVNIGTQSWMAENLKYEAVKRFIPEVKPSIPIAIDSNFTDPRDGKVYKYSTIGNKSWMTENLNYETGGSVCYNNQVTNCKTYGRLYNWATAMTVCPLGWHLPNSDEWENLTASQFVSGGYHNQTGGFSGIGELGYWWTSTDDGEIAYSRYISSISDNIGESRNDKSFAFSVRCVREEEPPTEETSEDETVDLIRSLCYDDKPANCKKYGMLYDWEMAMDACPKGWHLPSDSEWETLIDFIEVESGFKLKASDGWDGDGHGSDYYGFAALPSGFRSKDSIFYMIGNSGYWWTATDNGNPYAYVRYISYNSNDVKRDQYIKPSAFSVRCVREYKEEDSNPPKTVYKQPKTNATINRGRTTNRETQNEDTEERVARLKNSRMERVANNRTDDGLKLGMRLGFNFYRVSTETCSSIFGCPDDGRDYGAGFGGGLVVKNLGVLKSIPYIDISYTTEFNIFYRNTLNINIEDYYAYLTEFALSIPIIAKLEISERTKFWHHLNFFTGFQLDIPIIKYLSEKRDIESYSPGYQMNTARKFSNRSAIDYGIFYGFGYNITESVAIDMRTVSGLSNFSEGEMPLIQVGFGLTFLF